MFTTTDALCNFYTVNRAFNLMKLNGLTAPNHPFQGVIRYTSVTTNL